MEPSAVDIAMLGPPGTAARDERLVVASRLSTELAVAHSIEDVASIAVRRLHDSFDYYLAVIQRLDPDGSLRVVAGAGPLAEQVDDFLAHVQPVEVGVNGRVARSGRPAMVNDTRLDSDYLHRNPRTDPRLGALAADPRRRLGLGRDEPRAGRARRLRRRGPAARPRRRRPGRLGDLPLPARRPSWRAPS